MMRFCFFAACLFLSSMSFAVSFKVDDIQLEGLQRVSASPVFAALPIRSGDTVGDQEVRDIIQAMLGTGFFNDVQIARDGNVLIIILDERPAIKSISLDGNKLLDSEQLLTVMGDNGLKEGEIFKSHTLQGIARSIENQYISQARYDASVTTEVNELPNKFVSIDVKIDEGSPASIRHYNITGNTLFSDKELKKIFELGKKPWYKPFSKADKYSREKLTGDIESLESFYLDQGYLDFQILSSQVSISPDKESVYITLNINEGDIYTVSGVDLSGDPILSEERVKQLFLLREDDIFSQARMTRTSEFITTLLGNSGYTNANVEEITEKDTEANTVKITYFVDPGSRTYVRRINFSGNTKTKDEVLRREMRLFEGESASNARIEQSRVRLDRLGFFKESNVESVPVPGEPDLVDINFTVEEQPSGSISASVGYADFSGINLGLNVTENNWLGSGNNVSIGVNKNRFQENYQFSFTDPFFTPDGISRGITVFHRKTDFNEVNFSGSFSTDSTGVTATFGYPVSEISFLRFGVGYNFQSVTTGFSAAQQIQNSPFLIDDTELVYVSQSDFENILQDPPTIDGVPQEFQVETQRITEDQLVNFDDQIGFLDEHGSEFNSVVLNTSWTRRTLNRGVLATRGSSQTVSFEVAVPGSDLQYYKLTYEGQLFQPVTRDLTLRFRTQLGYGNGFGEFDEIPFFENFRSGGFGSVRGFERFTLGPKIVPAESYITTNGTGAVDIDNDGDLESVGGLAYVLCEDPSSPATLGCTPGRLVTQQFGLSNRSSSSFGGNYLVELSTELLLPIPFVEDSRSMQLVLFVDAGNVFSDDCRPGQFACSTPSFSDLSSSYGVGFKWLSALGPLTFSLARPINENELDQTKFFDFTFGAGF